MQEGPAIPKEQPWVSSPPEAAKDYVVADGGMAAEAETDDEDIPMLSACSKRECSVTFVWVECTSPYIHIYRTTRCGALDKCGTNRVFGIVVINTINT